MKIATSLAVLILGFAAAIAFAHTELSESIPGDQAVVATAPENITLKFSEAVRLTALTVQLDGAAKQSLGPLPAEAGAEFVVAAPGLSDGHYTVSWRALSADTHVMTGEFMFVIGAGNHAEHSGPANTSNASGAHAAH